MPKARTKATSEEHYPSAALPRYPIYIPSKGRHRTLQSSTFLFLSEDSVPFRVVVEPQEEEDYKALLDGMDCDILVLPFSNLGQGSIPARNWIRDHAVAEGHRRHWQLDDNIRYIRRLYRGERIPCDAGVGLRVTEDFSDRYTNVGVSGLNYQFFVTEETYVPYYLNVHVYSCTLVNHEMPYVWRGRYNEDTDLCLQALAGGWCTVLINTFVADKQTTMTGKGGNMTELYAGDVEREWRYAGREKMADALAKMWPEVVTVDTRYGRPQHVVDWKKFDHELKPVEGLDVSKLPKVDSYGLKLRALREPGERGRLLLEERQREPEPGAAP